jgi:Domain of unknown function (DU1801)
MAEAKTQPTKISPRVFIAGIANEARRRDAQALLKLFARVTGWKPRMWGPTIVGFGVRHYEYASGRSGSICAVGFSPRSANLVLYVANAPDTASLLKKLGKHGGGIDQCLYINKLADVDVAVLEKIVRSGLKQTKKTERVTAN